MFALNFVEIFGIVFRSIVTAMVALPLAMKRRILLFLIGVLVQLCASSVVSAQPDSSVIGYFSPPLDIPLYLAGNFAELRRNHFHTGIDIKTQGVEGHKVLAAAEGYVSRIKVSPFGYGKTLYLDHPNGYTTVYAHLKRFSADIEKIARAEQEAQESFAIDLNLSPNEVPVERGEMVAYSGNTGGSGGPHLHFEIRTTESELPLNPLLFGFPIEDNIKPTLRGLRVYPMTDSSFVSGRREDRSYVLRGGYGKYNVKNKETVQVYGDIAFGIHTYDLLNGYPNKCGVYNIKLFRDGELMFESQLDSLNFETFRQINTYKDYRLYHERGWHYHRSYLTPHNELEVYKLARNNGIMSFRKGTTHDMRYEVRDTYGNLSVLNFTVKAAGKQPAVAQELKPDADAVFRHDEENIFKSEDVVVIMPPYRLYEDIDFIYTESDTCWSCLTPLHNIHNALVPVDQYYTLRIRVGDLAPQLRDKVLVTKYSGSNSHKARGGRYKDGWISARVREFGRFTVRVDTTPPVIRPVNVFNGKTMTGNSRIDFKIKDNLAGIKHFSATIGEAWILMEYEPKKARLTHYLEKGAIPPGKHELVVKVTDDRNNTSTYRAQLVF